MWGLFSLFISIYEFNFTLILLIPINHLLNKQFNLNILFEIAVNKMFIFIKTVSQFLIGTIFFGQGSSILHIHYYTALFHYHSKNTSLIFQ